jgi:alkyl hydroperoxide reductase subunit AhpC
MALRLGDTAPDFLAATTIGPVHFYEWAGNGWVVLFSHPKDFTPVCTTELGYLARLRSAFDQRNVKVLGLSVDSLSAHHEWADDIKETQGQPLNFPLIADTDGSVARLYGMIHPQHDELHTVRTVFVIDPHKKIRLTISYPQSAGRNFDEILRVIDSLQLTDVHLVSTPVNWRAGDEVIIVPSLTDAEAAQRFPQGWRAPKPYLRLTPDPRSLKPQSGVDLDAPG